MAFPMMAAASAANPSAGLDSSPLALARFFAERVDARVNPILEDLKQRVEKLEAKAPSSANGGLDSFGGSTDRAGAVFGGRLESFDSQRLSERIARVESSMQNKADVELVRQLGQIAKAAKADATELGDTAARIANRLDALNVSGSQASERLNELERDVRQMQDAAAEAGSQHAASQETLNQYRNEVAKLTTRLTSMDQTLGQKYSIATLHDLESAGTRTTRRVDEAERAIQKLEGTLANAVNQAARIEQTVHERASSELQYVKQQTEAAVAKLQSQVEAANQAVQDRPTTSQFAKVKSGMKDFEAKLADVERGLQEKPSVAQIQTIKASMTGFEAKLATVEQAAQERLGAAMHAVQLKGSVAGLQSQVALLEQGLQEKLGAEDAQQLRGAMTTMQAQLASVEQGVREKASAAQMSSLKTAMEDLETKVAAVQRGCTDLAPLGEVQVLGDSAAALDLRLSRVEGSLREGMTCMKQLEQVIGNISTMTSYSSNIEQSMNSKMASAERSLRESIAARAEDRERMRRLEDALGDLGAQFGALRQVFLAQSPGASASSAFGATSRVHGSGLGSGGASGGGRCAASGAPVEVRLFANAGGPRSKRRASTLDGDVP